MYLITLRSRTFPFLSRVGAGHRTAKRHYAVGRFKLVAKDPKACTALEFGHYSRQMTGEPIPCIVYATRRQREVIIVRILA